MRAVAVVLLVLYHVIGSNQGAGLNQGYPAPLRLFADFLIDIRMPFFAFIAGYVYGLRPIAPGQYQSFILGKLRRLYVPGAIAAALFALLSWLLHTGEARSLTDVWEIFFFPYVHYWFLQAVLMIFVLFGALDMLLRGRFTALVLAAACALSLCDPFVPGNPMSINQAIYLAPFFLLGLVFIRHQPVFAMAPGRVMAGAALIALAASAWNIHLFDTTGRLSMDRQDPQSLAMGLSTCLLAILILPRLAALEQIGPYAFTIYLYHIFGTAAMRMALHAAGIEALAAHLVLGLAAGIALPALLHVMAERHPLGRRWILGKRR